MKTAAVQALFVILAAGCSTGDAHRQADLPAPGASRDYVLSYGFQASEAVVAAVRRWAKPRGYDETRILSTGCQERGCGPWMHSKKLDPKDTIAELHVSRAPDCSPKMKVSLQVTTTALCATMVREFCEFQKHFAALGKGR